MESTEPVVVLLTACADLQVLSEVVLLTAGIDLRVLWSLTMQHTFRHANLFCLAAAALCLSGCTSFSDYFHHDFKVGPEYTPAKAAVAPQWIDASDIRVRSHAADLSRWWSVFNDPVLNDLIYHAYNQNINLKEYGTRILQARYNLAMSKGEIFPQTQQTTGSYTRTGASVNQTAPGVPKWGDNFNYGFGLAWELDFWGLYRRQILNAQANLDASVDNYDAVLVTLLCDTAQYYVQMREYQEEIELTRQNAKLQRDVLKVIQDRVNAGTLTNLDLAQQQSTLSQVEAAIPAFEIQLRQAQDQLCTLLGIPPADLQARLGQRPIPAAPRDVVVGIPAQLLERRPDVRAAERNAAAQAQEIGIAQAELYPHISITGNLAYSAQNASQLFTYPASYGSVGPSFQWNILNYGRLSNNVRLQDAKFQQTLLDYRTAVLTANQEAEDGLISFLRSQEQARLLTAATVAADKAFQIGLAQYRVGTVDFNRLATLESTLVTSQISQAQAQSQIALGLIQVYRALGGGWEIRLGQGPQPAAAPAGTDGIPLPAPSSIPTDGPANPELPQAPQPPSRPIPS
jgi:NodT family efflux transporter outer membrane factor (OMF) lipoprotein